MGYQKRIILNLQNQIPKLQKDLSKALMLSHEVTQIVQCNHDLSHCEKSLHQNLQLLAQL